MQTSQHADVIALPFHVLNDLDSHTHETLGFSAEDVRHTADALTDWILTDSPSLASNREAIREAAYKDLTEDLEFLVMVSADFDSFYDWADESDFSYFYLSELLNAETWVISVAKGIDREDA